MPETYTNFDGTSASFLTIPSYPMPNNIQRATSRSRTRDVRLSTGTAGTGFLMVAPGLAAFGDAESLITSNSTFTATYWPDIGVDTGISQSILDSQSPYKAVDGDIYAWCGHLSISMKVNSSSVTNKQGRIYIGINVAEVDAGATANFTGVNFEALPTFRSWGVAQLSESNMPEALWIPQPITRKPDQVPTVTTINEPAILIWCEEFGSTPTILEFSVTYTSVVAGIYVPWDRHLHMNTDGILAVSNAMCRTASRGFSYPQSKRATETIEHVKEVQHTEVRKQPLLSRIINVGKTIAQKSGVGNLLKRALGWIPSLF